MLQNLAKQKIIAESKSQLQSTTQEMMNQVDQFIRENGVLKAELDRALDQQVELQSINETLTYKN